MNLKDLLKNVTNYFSNASSQLGQDFWGGKYDNGAAANVLSSAQQHFAKPVGNAISALQTSQFGQDIGQALALHTSVSNPANQVSTQKQQGDLYFQQAMASTDPVKKRRLLQASLESSLAQSQHYNNFLSDNNKQPLDVAKHAIGTLGEIKHPMQSLLGAPIGVGFNAVGNAIGGKPLLDNWQQAAKSGENISAELGPLSDATGILGGPLLSKIPQTGIPGKLLVSGLKGGLPFGAQSALEPAKNAQERIANTAKGFGTGFAFGATTQAVGLGLSALVSKIKGTPRSIVTDANSPKPTKVGMLVRKEVNRLLGKPENTPLTEDGLKQAGMIETKNQIKDLQSGKYGPGSVVRDVNKDQPPLGGVSNLSNKVPDTLPSNLGHTLPQEGGITTKSTQIPGQLPSESPIVGGGQTNLPGSPSSPTSISDPVNKIIQALKEAKPIRSEQQALYSKAMSQRTAKVAAMGSKVPGEQGYFAQLGQLKGQLPKAQFEGIRNQVGQNDINALFNQVEASNLSPLEKVTAKGGLANLLGKEGGQVPTRSELSLLNEIFPPEFTQAILDKRSGWQKFLSGAGDVLSVPRSLMASFDLSAPLRQGALIGPSHPKEYAGAFGNMFKYAVSEKAYQGMLQDITARPSYQAMRQSGLAITGKASPILNQREEAFMSNLAERIPGVGKIVRASDRAYTGFLNKLRADTFDTLWNNAKSNGTATPDVANGLATFINTATGRGELGALNRAGGVLSTALFSPRLLASRIQTMNPLYYTNLPPQARQEALKALVTFGGTALTVLGLAKMGGASVGADPRSADFGKIKVGNTRYDILAGFQQPIRLAAQLITGKSISTTTGKETTLGQGFGTPTRLDLLARFFQSKESPVVSFISNLMSGQDAIGQPFNAPAEVINRFIPMVAQDMYDLAKEHNSPLGALMGIPGVFGTGVQTYGKQIPNLQTTPTGKLSVKLSPVPGLAEDIANKITGQQPSNVPQDQQQTLVNSATQKTQNSVDVAKVKEQLQKGKSVDNNVQQTTYSIDGTPQQGYQVGKNFVYVDGNGDTQSKTVQQLQKSQLSYDKGLFDAQYSLTTDRLKRAGDTAGIAQLNEAKLKYYQDYKAKLDPKKDAKELISVQNTIEDLQYSLAGGKGKKPKKISIKSSKVSAPNITIKSSKTPKPKLTFKKTKTFMLIKGKAKAIPKFKITQGRNSLLGARNVIA